MTQYNLRSCMRLALVAAMMSMVVARPSLGQEPPPRIPWFTVDLHGTVPLFPTSNDKVALSHGLTSVAELPGNGLGVQLGLHLYPLRWHAITFGIGGEVSANRSRQMPLQGAENLRSSEEKFLSAAPQLSLNFGTGNGWSYLSGGVGLSQWSLIPEGQPPSAADAERLKTINYGAGARWFAKRHLAFSFDIRFYAINPGTPSLGLPASPRTTLMVIGAGVSLK